MTPAQAAYQATRQARAIAAGYTSYSQQHRAKKAGFQGGGHAFNAAIRTRKTNALQQAQASGRLVGLANTRAGRVIAALFLKQASGQWAAMRRLSDYRQPHERMPDGSLRLRHVSINVQMAGVGKSMTLGGRGGYSLRWLRQAVAAAGGWAAFILALVMDQYEWDSDTDTLEGATVTVVIA